MTSTAACSSDDLFAATRLRKVHSTLATSALGDGSLSIRLFGQVAVTCGCEELLKVRSRKGLWLLALVALRANQPVSRDWLAATLWPDSDDPRQTLRRTLTDLKTALGPCSGALEATTQALILRVPESNVDALAFDVLVRSTDASVLDAAIALYRGPLLQDCPEVWCEAERVVRAETYVQALQSAATVHAKSTSGIARAITYLRLGIAADPFRESLYHDLMVALAANGEPAEAIQVYRSLRLFLHDETRMEPAKETTALYRNLQASGAARTPAPTRPESIKTAGDDRAPGPNDEPLATNLPSPLTRILGREHELAGVASGLTESRLVTLVGMGGLGKTRLAIEAAHRLQKDFADGVWFVDLASIVDEELVARSVAAVLSVREEAGRPLTESLVDVLRERRTLIVMDNCEHLIEPSARLLRTLLTACGSLHVIATSRQPLGLTGEVVSRIAPLPLPDRANEAPASAAEVACALERSPALSLFAERVAAAQPGFGVTPQNIAAVTEICRRLDGIPLALELAAARTRSLSVAQVEARLGDRFRLLSSGDRAAPLRQQTLRALVDWSFDMLDPAARLLFARLSIFAGGWSLEACEEVCSDPKDLAPESAPGVRVEGRAAPSGPRVARSTDPPITTIESWEILDLLSDLVEKSLVRAEPQPDGEVRYRMLETLREYAAEKLEELGGREQVGRQHLQWCLRFTEAAEPLMRGPNQTRLLAEQMRDNDNLRQALQEAGPGTERMRLATALFWHWYVHGFYAEGRSWLERILQETPDAPVSLKCKAMKTAGDLCWAMGDMASAQGFHMRNMEVQCEANDRRGIGMTYNSLGLVAYHQGDCSAALSYYQRGLRILRELGDLAAVGGILVNLSLPLKEQGEYREAETLLAEADAIHRETGNILGLTGVLHSRCLIAKRLGDYERAVKFIQEAIAIDASHQNLLGEAVNLHTLGEIAFYQGDLETAERSYHTSLERFTRIGARRSVAAAICSLGEVATVKGELDRARALFYDSLEMDAGLGNRVGCATTIRNIAALEHSAGRTDRAAVLLAAVSAAIEQLGTPMPPNQVEHYERLLDDVRCALGVDSYDRLWRDGSAITLEAAIDLARAEER